MSSVVRSRNIVVNSCPLEFIYGKPWRPEFKVHCTSREDMLVHLGTNNL